VAATHILYETVLRDPARPIWVRLHRTFGRWTVSKGFPAPDTARLETCQELAGSQLTMERLDACGRYVLDEPCDGGVTRTKVVFLDGDDRTPGFAHVSVEQRGGERPLGTAPGFLPAYLRTERITDGAIHLEDTTAVLAEEDISRFMYTLTEPRRRIPVIVVAPDSDSSARADWLAAAVAGAGLVVRLADRRTEDAFNRALGAGDLRVYGGAIRTYDFPFDPATERNTYRHPPMRLAKLREEGDQALAKIADGVLARTARADFPDVVTRGLPVIHRVLAGRAKPDELATIMRPRPAQVDPAREELRRRMMAKTIPLAPAPASPASPAAAPAPTALVTTAPSADTAGKTMAEKAMAGVIGPEAASGLADEVAERVVKEMRQEVETALGLAADTDTGRQLLREIRTLGLHLAGLRDLVTGPPVQETGDLRLDYDVLQEEYTEAVTTARTLAARVRWLERTLAESGHPVYGLSCPEEIFQPGSLAEALVEARTSLARLVIGDTEDSAVWLDNAYPRMRSTWAAKAWDALRALNEFAEARSAGKFSRGFHDWCAGGAPGRFTIPAGMVAMRESRSVTGRGKFSRPRTFPVPIEVAPGGELLMEAHIKLRSVGYPAPRMHFHDDSGGATGKIYIGYVGDHLPNTRTN
jgi:hypothetical protein